MRGTLSLFGRYEKLFAFENMFNILVKMRFGERIIIHLLHPKKSTWGELGAVYINDPQYFADVPVAAREFYIDGYQPAQKWLEDRKGRTLNYEDIRHYQKIIVALSETERLMKEVDKVEIE